MSAPPAPPQIPGDFDELVRSGVRCRVSEWIAAGAVPALVLGAMSVGFLWNGEMVAGGLFLLAAVGLGALVWAKVRRRYGSRGLRWKRRVADHVARDLEWHGVEVWFATPSTWHPMSERQVLVALPGSAPHVMASAPRGTAASCTPGPGWVWGRAQRGEPLVVSIDGHTLWCVGPAWGRVGVAVLRFATKATPVLRAGLWLDRPGHPIRSPLKHWDHQSDSLG